MNNRVDLDLVFESVDVNNNGNVSFSEMLVWLAVYKKGTVRDKLTRTYIQYHIEYSSLFFFLLLPPLFRLYHSAPPTHPPSSSFTSSADLTGILDVFQAFDVDSSGVLDEVETQTVLDVLKTSFTSRYR